MDLSSYDLEYLRPPFEASFINHNIDYIKSGSGINAKRKIFYNVSFESDELKAIQELESLLQSQGITLPEEWNQSETLKFLYAQKFNAQAAAETIQTCLEWRDDPQTSLIDDNVLQYLEAGVIYIYGLDHQFRPILIINLNKLRHLQIDEDTFKIALVIVMDVIRTYCFLPRKIENCVILIDAQGVKTIDPDNIKAISYLLRSCFPSTFERIILITSPNFKDSHFQLIHSVANKEELEDVQIISSSDMKALQTFIPAEHLEKKYGGECPTVEKFWPPPKRNELYHRTSVTSLKQYSEAGSIGNIPKENLSALSKSNLSARQGNIVPETSELKQYTFADNPRTPQSVQSEMLKFQPNQLGGVTMTQSESFRKKSASPFEKAENLSQQRIPSNTKIPSQNDLRFKSEDNFGRNTAPIQPGSNQESPSKKYKGNDPFARVRNEEAAHSGRTNLSVYPHNNNNGINLESADRFVIREAEAPKMKKPVNHWDMKMEPTSLHKQLSSQASEIDSQSRAESPIQGKRKMLPTTTVTPTHRRESSQTGDLGNRVSYAVYGGGGSNNKPAMGYQNEVDNGNMRPQQGNGRTFEENEVDTPSVVLYSQQEKEKVKKRLVEISAKKAEESDEEDAKSKKGLFCGCCVGAKKKDTLLRSKSKMKKSKYDH